MLYEKKMLILSGDGKGVVLIEKSAHGVRFTLRTFDMPPCPPLKAGIVTKNAVYVRDLPHKDNPAATFSVDDAELDSLHFAVFDRELRLYGCIGKKMWESNLMDLLAKHERRAPVLDGVSHAPLPPITKQPRVLPMPDGSGIPQSRLAVYGDDALADSDFYTHMDFSRRMPVVDGFLDTPRTLDELAPRVQPSDGDAGTDATVPVIETSIEELTFGETTATRDSEERELFNNAEESEDDAAQSAGESESDEAQDADGGNTVTREDIEATMREYERRRKATGDGDAETVSKGEEKSTEANADTAEAAAVSVDSAAPMPWEAEARWIKKRGGREPVVKRAHVRNVPNVEKLKRLRATEFFERARRDIDILFASARRDESLAGLIDDVEWVKVDVDGNTVSVGRSGKAFLCYAVAGTYERVPPLGDEAQWLPSDRNAPTGKGYWVIFQNLVTGEIIKG